MAGNTNDFRNNTTRFFHKLCMICYCTGISNFWMEALPFPKKIDATYRIYSKIITVLIYGFILSEIASPFTQNNLNVKQESDLMVYMMSHPMLWSYCVSFTRHADQLRKVLVGIIKMKQVYNDVEVEKKMMTKSKFYSTTFCGMCAVSMLMYTFDAVMVVFKQEGTFTTIITAWPLVDDTSLTANLLRVVWNVLWWSMMIRVLSVYAFVFSLISGMSYQFVDLRSYFLSLDKIFEQDGYSQRQKELQYEAAYKIGIKLHSDTMQCVALSKAICGWTFSGQIIFNITMLVIFMTQMLKAERDLMHVGAIAVAAFCILLGTGLCMCNAGDVTVEASEVCKAMYSSGWHKCQGPCSARVRKLVMISMIYAQRPVVITGLGIMNLSYQSFVSVCTINYNLLELATILKTIVVVKSTYSVFSLVFQRTS